jgi:GT2 family glycosyltransferase
MFKKIAVLLTCYNRKNKTSACLKHLFDAYSLHKNSFTITVYLTDDGSSDGTTELISKLFPEVIVLQGTGQLYWVGGMINSWKEAVKTEYDGFLLLNDDTIVYDTLFDEIIRTHEFSKSNYGCDGIYVGSTKEIEANVTSYGGAVFTNKFLLKYKKLDPDNTIQKCELANANIMFVSRDTYNRIGMLSSDYVHVIADYAYTLTAKKHKIPVLMTANYCGICSRNLDKGATTRLLKMNFNERVKFLYHPLGLVFQDNLNFMKTFFPYRLPFVFFAGWFKIVFPRLYIAINRLR